MREANGKIALPIREWSMVSTAVGASLAAPANNQTAAGNQFTMKILTAVQFGTLKRFLRVRTR